MIKEQDEIIKMLCNSKANENNTIDLNAYAIGLNEMYCYLSHSYKDKLIADRDKRILELTEQMNLLRMDSRDTIDAQNVIIFDQTNRIKELEKEVHRLQFSL